MSWDVYFQDLPAGIRSVEEVPDDFQPGPLCGRAELLAVIRSVLPDIDLSDATWGVVERDDFSIELDLGSEDPNEGFALHMRDRGAHGLRLARRRPGPDEGVAVRLRRGRSGSMKQMPAKKTLAKKTPKSGAISRRR